MNFKTYYTLNEGLISVPIDYIKSWVDNHIDEIISKIKETIKTKYETYVDDNLLINGIEIPVIIVNKTKSSNAFMSFYFSSNEIYIYAPSIVSYMKNKQKFKNFIYSSIIHEITHMVDKGNMKKKTNFDNDTYSTYINSDLEFPAFANEMINKILNKTEEQKLQILDSLRYGKAIKDREVNQFMKYLNEKNKIKFINYVVKNINN